MCGLACLNTIKKASAVQQAIVPCFICKRRAIVQDVVGNQTLACLQAVVEYRAAFIGENFSQIIPGRTGYIIITPLDIPLTGTIAHV